MALVLIGAAAVYAGTTIGGGDRSDRDEFVQPDGGLPSPRPSTSRGLSPTEPADRGLAFCLQVQAILSDEFVDLDVDFVESRRAAAGRLRELAAPTSTHRAARDELADELEALAETVEEDPAAEAEASERGDEAVFAFIDGGGCDPV